jgi:hypothetical protein
MESVLRRPQNRKLTALTAIPEDTCRDGEVAGPAQPSCRQMTEMLALAAGKAAGFPRVRPPVRGDHAVEYEPAETVTAACERVGSFHRVVPQVQVTSRRDIRAFAIALVPGG